jgi:hypothetical protein
VSEAALFDRQAALRREIRLMLGHSALHRRAAQRPKSGATRVEGLAEARKLCADPSKHGARSARMPPVAAPGRQLSNAALETGETSGAGMVDWDSFADPQLEKNDRRIVKNVYNWFLQR